MSKKALSDWKALWTSPGGKAAVAKFEQLKTDYINYAMAAMPGSANEAEQQRTAINRAQGVQEVLNLINTGLFEANKPREEADEEKTK
jgi:hypothetical protein